MSLTQLESPFGSYTITRLPQRRRETLQGWDAADEYLLKQLSERLIPETEGGLLVVNDTFGALAVALHRWQPMSWSDSSIAHAATRNNYQANGLTDHCRVIPSTEPLVGLFAVVLLKVPKTLALLEHQLALLRPHLRPDSVIIAAGMVKGVHRSTLALFERYLGPTTTSLAIKKARLILPQQDMARPPLPSPYPTVLALPELGLQLTNHANLFSREQLDIGSRFMLQQFPQLPPASRVVDLGCGNGVLGIMARRQLPLSHITFIDESYMAVAAARLNYGALYGDDEGCFITHDCFPEAMLQSAEQPQGQVDLVLCNPPFHQQNTISGHIAERMMDQSQRLLRRGGELWLVGNRHLNYQQSLQRCFGSAELVAANSKFVVLRAIKR